MPQDVISMQPQQMLQFLVKYLFKVCGYAFYSGVRQEDERCLSLKCFTYERAKDCEEPSPEAIAFETNYVTQAEQLVSAGP